MSDNENRLLREAFEDWILQPENMRILRRLADKIHKQIGKPGHEALLDSISSRHSDEKDLRQEILNAFIVFILQTSLLQEKILGDEPQRFHYVKTAFIRRLKDENRRRPWTNLYRNTNRVLRDSGRFTLYHGSGKNPKALAFSSLTGTDNDIPAIRLEKDDFPRIPFPRSDSISFEKINTKKQLIPLAEYFLEQVALLSGRPAAKVYLKDFIAWITRNVVVDDPINKKSGDAPVKTKSRDGGTADSAETLFSSMASDNDNLEEALGRKQQQQLIPVWAENLANLFDDMARRLFYYRHCAGLTHQELAARMGSKSNLTYQLNMVLDQLKHFLRPLPWLSPEADEGPDEEAFQLFIEKLCCKLKKIIPEPY